MLFKSLRLALIALLFLPFKLSAQIDEDQMGAWYMYFWTTTFGESQWGLQGDAQFRNWNIAGDLEQLLLRGGLTYKPEGTNALLTFGYANIQTGEFGDGTATVGENRIYQEALLPHKIGKRVYLKHRFRYEQRFVSGQDFRTRYRYNLFFTVPLNQEGLGEGAIYLALYNELFINGQRTIGDGRTVEIFDRNRLYGAFGYSLKDNLKVQVGIMQQTTDNWQKNQIQLSLHHNIGG
ncbi:MAG: DUF2490 domain-containing protein [Bacteroidota bacterium]